MNLSRVMLTLGVVVCLGGCGDDDSSRPDAAAPTATAVPTTAMVSPTPTGIPTVPPSTTAPSGPVITFIGITRADDSLVEPTETSPEGIQIFSRQAGSTGGASGFRLVVEGRRGSSGRQIALDTSNDDITQLPDLQIQVNRPLGNGSAAVCDGVMSAPLPPGGVPAVAPPSFVESTDLAHTINDLACRFRDGIGATKGIDSPLDGCVKLEPTEDYGFVSSESNAQFCGFISAILQFPRGDTLLTVRLRDVDGNVGAPAQMVIRVN